MRSLTLVAALFATLFLLVAGTAAAQTNGQKPAVYTYVAQWSIPRAQWGDMGRMQHANTAALDRLVADGTLVAYGSDENMVHDRKGDDFSNWFQATSLAGIFKALDALQGSTAGNAALLGSGPHQDNLLVSRDYDGHSGSFHNALLRGITAVVKPGMESQFHDSWDHTIRPVLEQLTAEGALHGWAYHTEWVVKQPGQVVTVIIANGPAGLDRYVAAINDLLEKNPDAVMPLIAATEPGSRRDFLVRVTDMRQK